MMKNRVAMLVSVVLAAGCLFLAADNPGPRIDIPADVVRDKIRGGLLGQILGDLNGLKHEMKYIAEPGNVDRYTPALPEGAWTDDDTDIEWVYVLDMQRSNTTLLSPRRISELWKRHINSRIWCSHQYLRQLIDIGIEPPLTGRVQFNPWADFNLSGQFVSETWGLISPGMPQTASRIGLHYTHVSIDLEPAQSTQLFATMIATAFLTADMEKILDAGLAALDPKSAMRRIVLDVRRWHQQNAGDWRATRKLIKEKYSYYGGDDPRDKNGVQLNAAATIASLLYGGGDFVETVRHAFNFGWDCDNNAAAAGTIVGVIKGKDWMIDQGWRIEGSFRNTSRDGMPNDETIASFGDRLIALAERVIAEHGGAKLGSGGETVYRIQTEAPANVERLANPAERLAFLRSSMKSEIEKDMVHATDTQRQARAAYLAICLDLAPDLRKKYPEQWARALAALNNYPKVLQVLFFQSPVPAGERLREKALAAGLQKPPHKEKIW